MSNEYVCTSCGMTEDSSKFSSTSSLRPIMEANNLCFHCAFWFDKIQHPDENCEIINGKYYIFETILYPKSILDKLCRKDICVIHSDNTVRIGNHVRLLGVIPPLFRPSLPDTAKYIGKKLFRNLEDDLNPCSAKGCWDRYHCFRYDLSAEPPTPWNVIPKSHKVGDERCYRFINIKDIPTWK